jgi:hypothetical protein
MAVTKQTRPERLGLSQEDLKEIYRQLGSLEALDAHLDDAERTIIEIEEMLARQVDRDCPTEQEQ